MGPIPANPIQQVGPVPIGMGEKVVSPSQDAAGEIALQPGGLVLDDVVTNKEGWWAGVPGQRLQEDVVKRDPIGRRPGENDQLGAVGGDPSGETPPGPHAESVKGCVGFFEGDRFQAGVPVSGPGVEPGGVLAGVGEKLDPTSAPQRPDQQRGVVGDAAPKGVGGTDHREIPHCRISSAEVSIELALERSASPFTLSSSLRTR